MINNKYIKLIFFFNKKKYIPIIYQYNNNNMESSTQ